MNSKQTVATLTLLTCEIILVACTGTSITNQAEGGSSASSVGGATAGSSAESTTGGSVATVGGAPTSGGTISSLGGSAPAATGGSMTLGLGGSTPTATGGSTPLGTGGTTNVATGGSIHTVTGGANATGGVSAATGGTTVATGGASAATGGHTSTSGAGGATAASCHAAGTLMVTNQGASAYLIDGAANPTLTLCRGSTYTFSINTPGHPFYIKSVQSIGTANAYDVGVTGNGAATGNVMFTVPSAAPNTLFYDCSIHAAMAGTLDIVN
jgi:hypothetical protein